MDPDTEMGPIAHRAQYESVLARVEEAHADGARMVAGGEETPGGLFVRPTVSADGESGMRLAQHEVFGPVLAVLRFRDEEDSIRIANDTRYGLASGIWTSDITCAHRVAKRLEGRDGVGQYLSDQRGAGAVRGSGPQRVRPGAGHRRLARVHPDQEHDDRPSGDTRDPFRVGT
jgi:acyl-CoA reductase-like NAD-dependent aldehyde dehydrogenase